jgi:carboxymethylenebutenolidase
VTEFTTKAIECANGMPGYLALPKTSGKVPGVIILHERYGFVQHPRDVAERFARLGVAGLAINGFFKCNFQDSLADGTKRYYMSDPESVDYMTAAIQALNDTGRVDTTKIAALGMCQTGRHPMVMAAETRLLAAAICWYGAGADREFEMNEYYPKPLEDVLARVNCPLLGLFGEIDGHIPVHNVRRIRDALEQNGKTFDINVYEGAPHGFLNNTMLERYRHAQSEAAWRMQMDFLHKAFTGGFDRTRAVQHYAANLAADYRHVPFRAHA